ncbi:phosphopantetheine-binding protein [Labedaea rhizosphaerae]|uniref:Phosphopantetheine binding protein n=1 Tax=Labedaea rhizosphaerae TaxID=598644 RepID=A0A4R6S0X3_LABRH|nr:phosphopantetheine-binding protein [Labedaea rhizosphaerae]TDP92854.1 phosphopantetheine binding protein [Labedaea rhizosphaerae]
MTAQLDLDSRIARYATAAFDDDTSVMDAGLESLSLLRLAVEVAADDDAEIDATRMAGVRTIGELKQWLGDLAVHAGGDAA